MMWFRFYTAALDDPKVQRLSPPVFKGWINILCLAGKNKGALPSLADIAFALRVTEHEADTLIQALMAAGLVDDVRGEMRPHNWEKRQYEDATNAERQKRFRDKQKSQTVTRYGNGSNAVTLTTRTDTDTDTEQNKSDALARIRSIENLAFPNDGSIEYSRWAGHVRMHCPGKDPDHVANLFRGFCQSQGIPYDRRGIEQTFISFCKTASKKRATA